MAAVTYDEAADAALHRFLSFLRLLMDAHPRVGAREYARYLGLQTDLVPGWNAVHSAAGDEVPVHYIFISPERGLFTEERPGVPDDQIHVTHEDDLPPFETSHAWEQVRRLADLVSERQPQGVTPAWVRERVDRLRALAAAPLRGGDPSVDDRIGRALAGVRAAVNGPQASLTTFTEPVAAVVDDFLDFHLTKRQASNVLAVLFVHYAIKVPSPVDRTAGVEPVKQQVEHLNGLVSTIVRERHRYDLGSFSRLTYLGLLWADTAVLMGKQLARRSAGERLVDWFERRALFADETAAHYLHPSVMHPVSLVPFGDTENLRARQVGIGGPKGLYAGAGSVADGPLVPEDVWPRVRAYSASHPRLGADGGPYGQFLSPALVEHLTMFLLAMKLGRSTG